MSNQPARLIEVKSTQVREDRTDVLILINPEKIVTLVYDAQSVDIWFDECDALELREKQVVNLSLFQLEQYVGCHFPKKRRKLTINKAKVRSYIDGYDHPDRISKNVLNLNHF